MLSKIIRSSFSFCGSKALRRRSVINSFISSSMRIHSPGKKCRSLLTLFPRLQCFFISHRRGSAIHARPGDLLADCVGEIFISRSVTAFITHFAGHRIHVFAATAGPCRFQTGVPVLATMDQMAFSFSVGFPKRCRVISDSNFQSEQPHQSGISISCFSLLSFTNLRISRGLTGIKPASPKNHLIQTLHTGGIMMLPIHVPSFLSFFQLKPAALYTSAVMSLQPASGHFML